MGRALRVFLDANILFSACRSAGAIRQLLQALEAQGHVLVADTYVCAEARRNLAAKGSAGSLELLEALLARVEVGAMQPARPATFDMQWLTEKDQPVLSAASALKCDVLVTGDKAHFGVAFGQTHGGVRVCSSAQLFALM